MRVLVVHCHPNPESYSGVLRDAVVRGLEARHHVDVVNLAQDNFNPVMSLEEWESYLNSDSPVAGDVARYMDLVRQAEMFVFVYPTWWSGVPAQLKGWIERVFVLGLAFEMDNHRMHGGYMKNVKRIHVVTTFGSPRWYVKFVNDNGRRLFSRAIKLCTPFNSKFSQSALYALDKRTQADREEFISRVERTMQKI